jgi:hypothetical protein
VSREFINLAAPDSERNPQLKQRANLPLLLLCMILRDIGGPMLHNMCLQEPTHAKLQDGLLKRLSQCIAVLMRGLDAWHSTIAFTTPPSGSI